eukprot:gb/GECH01006536.1/.p1 GENE.gb/GECH01006536.1/~~gb/GECH01006536.1/.p1  ORF type:complete len:121 (+),score=33.54 gb/GECH01006536.1/:1-363(+)
MGIFSRSASKAARPKYSGLQRQVFSLYREFLDIAEKKGEEQAQPLKEHIRSEFKARLNVSPRDFQAIEYHLRVGRQQLELLSSSNVNGLFLRKVEPKPFKPSNKKLTPITAYRNNNNNSS